jgi:hypothetical protein
LFAPLCGCPATLCLCRAVNEDMKRAATYAIAALAKRPIMKRRPSAGDLLRLADPQQGSVAAGAGAPSKDHSEDLAAATEAATAAAEGGTAANGDAAHANGTAAEGRVGFASAERQGNGTAAAAGRAESTISSSTLSTDTAATVGVSASEVNSAGQRHSSPSRHHSPSRQHSHHSRSGSAGRAGHMRRKSYGELLQAYHGGRLRFLLAWRRS